MTTYGVLTVMSLAMLTTQAAGKMLRNTTQSQNVKMHHGTKFDIATQAAALNNATAALNMLGLHPYATRASTGCTPVCEWECTNPVCEQACEPECQTPHCETRCHGPGDGAFAAGCTFDCSEPDCAVVCPEHQCKTSGCPQCKTICGDPQCTMDCPAAVMASLCHTVCEDPLCEWSCKSGECPEPQCSLKCTTPSSCKGTSYHRRGQMPRMAAGEAVVSAAGATK